MTVDWSDWPIRIGRCCWQGDQKNDQRQAFLCLTAAEYKKPPQSFCEWEGCREKVVHCAALYSCDSCVLNRNIVSSAKVFAVANVSKKITNSTAQNLPCVVGSNEMAVGTHHPRVLAVSHAALRYRVVEAPAQAQRAELLMQRKPCRSWRCGHCRRWKPRSTPYG